MYHYFFNTNSASFFKHEQSPKLSRFVMSNDPNWQSGHHRHSEEIELIYLAEGKATFTIESETYHAQAGDLILIEKGHTHAISSDQHHPAITWTCAIQNFQIEGEKEISIAPPHTYPVVKSGDYQKPIENIIQAIYQILKLNENISAYTCHNLVSALTVLYHECFKSYSTPNPSAPKIPFIKNIMNFLNDNYNQKITLKQLAEMFHVSESYISHQFAKDYKISPISYIITRRITQAKFALTNSDNTLAEISYAVGYDDVDHFTKLFIKHVGQTPSEYRKQFKCTNESRSEVRV